jgi:hypothetical protein
VDREYGAVGGEDGGHRGHFPYIFHRSLFLSWSYGGVWWSPSKTGASPKLRILLEARRRPAG